MAKPFELVTDKNRERLAGRFDGDGGGGNNGDMEARIAKLEALAEKTSERLAAIEKDMAVVKSNYSTKADVLESKNSVILWVISAFLLTQLLPAILKKFGL